MSSKVQFAVGDVVVLKSGSRPMTVAKIEEAFAPADLLLTLYYERHPYESGDLIQTIYLRGSVCERAKVTIYG
jgi:hypothetical protein